MPITEAVILYMEPGTIRDYGGEVILNYPRQPDKDFMRQVQKIIQERYHGSTGELNPDEDNEPRQSTKIVRIDQEKRKEQRGNYQPEILGSLIIRRE